MPAKILIVEDDADIRQGLIIRLRANQYDVVCAGDAISAVTMVQRERPHLVILDIGLPGGDGFLVMERLRLFSNDVPIIVLSARDPALNRERALTAGARAFLQKPANNAELLSAIADLLKDPATNGSTPAANLHKVLVVEDDNDIRQGLIVRLRANSYDTVWAEDAISAVSVAQKEKPDLVILDIGLPGGDGSRVMDRLKSVIGSVPVIVLSARDPVLNRERALRLGAFAFIQKPADNAELLATMKQALLGVAAAA